MTGKLKTFWKACVLVALAASSACTADAAEARQADGGPIVEEPLARQASPEPAPHTQESSVVTSGQVDQSRRTAIVLS